MVDPELKAEYEKALQSAWNLISYRPRSSRELKSRLSRKGYSLQAVDLVIQALAEAGEVDDAAFSRLWVSQRESGKPMGKRRIQHELASKGVAPEVISKALEDYDFGKEYSLALSVARQRWSRVEITDNDQRQKAVRRLAAWLGRRGFTPEVIQAVLREIRVWDCDTNS